MEENTPGMQRERIATAEERIETPETYGEEDIQAVSESSRCYNHTASETDITGTVYGVCKI